MLLQTFDILITSMILYIHYQYTRFLTRRYSVRERVAFSNWKGPRDLNIRLTKVR